MAIAGFGLVFLGFTHFLNVFGISILLLVEGCLFWRLGRGNWLSSTFWRTMLERMTEAWMAGRIHVDPFLRFPYYANNFLLLYSALFIFKLSDYCQFLTWLCGLLSCLGVLAFFTHDSHPQAQSLFWKRFQPQQFLIPLCVALSPIFLRYLNVAMVDIPIGLFVLVPILCAYRRSSGRPYERDPVATGAFCAGMKLTLIGHLPLFLGSLFLAAARRLRRREIALLSLTLIALSLP